MSRSRSYQRRRRPRYVGAIAAAWRERRDDLRSWAATRIRGRRRTLSKRNLRRQEREFQRIGEMMCVEFEPTIAALMELLPVPEDWNGV